MEIFSRKWLYHKTEGAKLVETKEEYDALKGDWKEVPFAEPQESHAKAQEPESDQAEANEDSEESEIKLIPKKKHKGDK